ncbi:MAG: EAL domain-containing protein, partial [Usitatibacteraceae bacterium]
MQPSPPPRILHSRVGKRVLLLFVATALVPLAALAALSLTQVRALLLEQGSTRLANAAKTYATGVYERLLTAHEIAVLIASQPAAVVSPEGSNARGIVNLVNVSSDGTVRVLRGSSLLGANGLAREFENVATKPRALLRRMANGKLVLTQAASHAQADGILVAELDAGYVWGDPEDRKAGLAVCVAEGVTFTQLYCPDGQDLQLPALLKVAVAGIEKRELVWNKGGIPYRGRVWAQFLRNDFGSPDWYFAASVPEDELLAAVYAFRSVFFPVVLLALILIAWFSLRQTKSMVVPLGILTTGTRRLAANDFSARVKVDSTDEFGELADAFNSMSVRLGRQFQVSQAHGEIDRRILERHDLDRIVEATLSHAKALLPDGDVSAILLDRDGQETGRLLRLRDDLAGDDARKMMIDTVAVPRSSWPDLSSPTLSRYDRTALTPEWLRLAASPAEQQVWVQPLVWGTSVCGWLLATSSQAKALGEDAEGRQTMNELASRLSVAVASAWREDELFQRAHFDSLTGLPNRSLFSDRLQLEIARCRREGRSLAVMFVDLDHFKSVNDSHGHGAGDGLLCESARRIREAIRESDTVSRHGGDEFTVLLTDFREQRDALYIADNVIRALSLPFTIAGQDCYLSATIGIAIFPETGETVEELLKHADTAMYRAKAAGRGQALFFADRMNEETVARLRIDRELRQALERGELELYYQPQVSLKQNRVLACEALVRWNHPVRGLLGPGAFIPVAEEVGLIGVIGRWVIEAACRQIAQWRHEELELERISVNVSAKQFREAGFAEHIRTTVGRAGLASSIEFEITETVLLEESDLLEQKLKLISALGSTIALDDFGTGFSSMAYLKKLPVDCVKIDRLFVEDIDRSSDGRAFVQAIIS